MDEEATFQARAVLAPGRRRLSRLLLLVPALALAGIGAVGIAGPHAEQPLAAVAPAATAAEPDSPTPRPQHPTTVLGLEVQRLDRLDAQAIDTELELAIAGWYATTTITGCPELAAIYQDGQLPYVRGDADKLAFCVRSGVLYATEPDAAAPPTNAPRNGPARDPALDVLPVTVAIGVVMPPEIEVIGAGSVQVVVLGRFVAPTAGCVFLRGCGGDFVVDHIAWTPLGALVGASEYGLAQG